MTRHSAKHGARGLGLLASRRAVLARMACGGAALAFGGFGGLASGSTPAFAQAAAPQKLAPPVVPARRAAKLRRGLNASLWFDWVPGDPQARIRQIDGKYQARDFAQMRALGFDHVRVSIQPGFLAPNLSKGDPTLNPERLKMLDGAMQRIAAQGLALVLDNHPASPTKDKLAAEAPFRRAMSEWWRSFAAHVAAQRQYGAETTFLELFNEPEQSWNDNYKYRTFMAELIAAARAGAPEHTLIVGGNQWNVPEALVWQLKTPFTEQNVIYTFHYYEPKSFTHQGLVNAGDFYSKLKGVPWGRPANGISQAELAGFDPSVRDSMQRYGQKSQQKADIRPVFKALRDWCDKTGQIAWLGEFGVYVKNAPELDRIAWTRAVRELCEENDFGWCLWEARGGFGLFRPGEERPLTADRQLLDALTL